MAELLWPAPSGMLGGMVVLVALGVDARWGEPPARWHPVVAMGACLGWCGKRIAPLADEGLPNEAFSVKNLKIFCVAALYWVAVAALFLGIAWVLQAGVWWGMSAGLGAMVPAWGQAVLAGVVLGVLLKPMLAHRMLCEEVAAVEAALQVSLTAGRERLQWLVSRDVTGLSEAEVRESAIETLAENLNDSVVAPLFWFAVAGLPGAVLYRMANTADAMWGYRGVRAGRVWTWAGKWAARVDDGLSWPTARLTAALLWAGLSWARWRRLSCEAKKTPSPNGGWCMGAMALALGVRLGKPQVYVLNHNAPVPDATSVALALKYAKKIRLTLVLIAFIAIFSGLFI